MLYYLLPSSYSNLNSVKEFQKTQIFNPLYSQSNIQVFYLNILLIPYQFIVNLLQTLYQYHS